MAEKTERFGLALSPIEKQALNHLADYERISAAAVIRRLIYHAAYEKKLWPTAMKKRERVFSTRGKR